MIDKLLFESTTRSSICNDNSPVTLLLSVDCNLHPALETKKQPHDAFWPRMVIYCGTLLRRARHDGRLILQQLQAFFQQGLGRLVRVVEEEQAGI